MARRLRSLTATFRHVDHTFEKLMKGYKHYLRTVPIIDLILASPSQTLPLYYLSKPFIYQRFNLNKGPRHFIRTFPRIFSLSPEPITRHPLITLTDVAAQIKAEESAAADAAVDQTVDRLVRLLMMSPSRALPLRAIFRVWKELGLPDQFEDRVLKARPDLFRVRDNPKEKNTHILELVGDFDPRRFEAKVEGWRREWRSGEGAKKKNVHQNELMYGFKQQFPPCMKLSEDFRSKLKKWQRLPYAGPYQHFNSDAERKKSPLRRGVKKRAVGFVHEFLSLTVEKMVELEQFTQFRNCFGLDLNIRDLLMDHPGIFYISVKGKRHTVFLREAYEKGRLREPNPIYDARRKLLQLVLIRRRLGVPGDATLGRTGTGAMEEGDRETVSKNIEL